MTRFIPQQSGTVRSWGAGIMRPPLELLPGGAAGELAKLLLQHDRVAAQVSDAETEYQRVSDPAREVEAKAIDESVAVEAAKAGKPTLPKPVAVPQLEIDRQAAERAFGVQQAALVSCRAGLEDWTNNYLTEHEAEIDRRDTENRERVEALADELADAIEAAVAGRAITDWLRGERFYSAADVFLHDVEPRLGTHWGLRRADTQPIAVRQIAHGVVSAVFDEESA